MRRPFCIVTVGCRLGGSTNQYQRSVQVVPCHQCTLRRQPLRRGTWRMLTRVCAQCWWVGLHALNHSHTQTRKRSMQADPNISMEVMREVLTEVRDLFGALTERAHKFLAG